MKKKRYLTFQCIGRSSSEVTQSCYQIIANDHVILLDCGLYQCADPYECYKVNRYGMDEVRISRVEYIIISHANIDHCGVLPYLYKKGCKGITYVPKGNKKLLKLMFLDSAKILSTEALKLRHAGVNVLPLYTEKDVEKCMDFIKEQEFNESFTLFDGAVCMFSSAHHIVASAQIDLLFKIQGLTKRIHYTGDIGSPVIPKYYVENFDPPMKCDLLIGESTYAGVKRPHSNKDRDKDIEKIQTVIRETCIEKNSKVLFPVFALDRLQTMLTVLYTMYGNDESFNIPIIVDTPLGKSICDIWKDIIKVDKSKWKDVISWNNIKFTSSWEDSLAYQDYKCPMIILSSSGMCTNGRSVAWVKSLLPDSNAHICFCGYSAKDTIASKIKDGKRRVSIEVEGKSYKNKCGISTLNSFSSHACRSELLDIYSSCAFEKLLLVHGNRNDKIEFGYELSRKLSGKSKSSRVITDCMEKVITLI